MYKFPVLVSLKQFFLMFCAGIDVVKHQTPSTFSKHKGRQHFKARLLLLGQVITLGQ